MGLLAVDALRQNHRNANTILCRNVLGTQTPTRSKGEKDVNWALLRLRIPADGIAINEINLNHRKYF